MVRIVDSGDRRIEAFNARPAFPEEAERAAAAALAEIRARGDAAVVELVATRPARPGRGKNTER